MKVLLLTLLLSLPLIGNSTEIDFPTNNTIVSVENDISFEIDTTEIYPKIIKHGEEIFVLFTFEQAQKVDYNTILLEYYKVEVISSDSVNMANVFLIDQLQRENLQYSQNIQTQKEAISKKEKENAELRNLYNGKNEQYELCEDQLANADIITKALEKDLKTQKVKTISAVLSGALTTVATIVLSIWISLK